MPFFGPPNVKKLKANRDVQGLIKALYHKKNRGVRWDAREALVKIGKPAVESLIAALNDSDTSDTDVQKNAAVALGEIGDARAVEPLIAALNHWDTDVKWGATKALGEIGDVRAVEPLITMLNNRNTSVKQKAAIALGEIGDARAVEPLIAMLKPDYATHEPHADERWDAAAALGKIGDVRAVEPLIAVLKRGVTLEEESAKVKAVIETALQSILEQSGSSIGSHELRRIAQLEDVKYLVSIPSRGDEDYDYYPTIDCSQIRQLARQEIAHREPTSVLPLRGIIMHPQTYVPLTVELPSSIKLVDDAITEKRDIALVASKDPDIESPNPEDLYEIGTLTKIHRILRSPDGTIRILVEGLARIKIEEYIATDPYPKAKIRGIPETVESSAEVEALMHKIIDLFTKLADNVPSLSVFVPSVSEIVNPIQLAYTVGTFISIDRSEAQMLLELDSTQAKLQLLVKILEEKIA